MLQEKRDWLFNIAYGLDNKRRVAGFKKGNSVVLADKAPTKGYTKQEYVIFTHEELEAHAAGLRKLAEDDGARVAAMESKGLRRGN